MLGGAGARRQVGVRALLESLGAPAPGCRACGDHDDARLGPADAQAHLPAHRSNPAVVDAPLRHADRRLGPGRTASAGSLLRHPRDERFETWTMADLAFLALIGKKPRAECAVPNPHRPAALERSGRDLRAGRQGRGLRRRPGDTGRVQLNKAMVGFLTHSGYATAATATRASPSCSSSSRTRTSRSDRSEARTRPEGDGDPFATAYAR